METAVLKSKTDNREDISHCKPIKIALTGKMRSGKDTFAKMLMELDEFQHVKFSKGISEIVHKFIPSNINGQKLRSAYQLIGQTMRAIDEDVWIRYAFKDIDMSKNIIVTDLRQENECQFLKDNGFTIIKIVADDNDRINRMNELHDKYSKEDLNHETELAVDNINEDIVVCNDSTLEDLRLKAEILKIYLDK